jgi:hypothetical protein
MAAQKETPGQEEMPETGEELDSSQKDQLADFMNFEGGSNDDAQEEESGSESQSQAEESGEEEGGAEEEGAEGGEDGDESEPRPSSDSESDPEVEADPAEDGGDESEDDPEGTGDFDLLELRAQMVEQQKLINTFLAAQAERSKEPEVPAIEFDASDFLNDEDVADLMLDPRKVLTKLAEKIYIKTREDSMKDIPRLVESGARRQSALMEAQVAFRADNADLVRAAEAAPAVARLIRITADELQAGHPDWTLPQIFKETGTQVRNAINLGQKARKIESDVTGGKKRKSVQPGKPRGKRSAPGKQVDKRSGLQKELDGMLDSVQ